MQFGFNPTAAASFQEATKRIAQRGQRLSSLGQTLDQHFAVTLDGTLLTVPSIDFRAYPAGIPGAGGADITGGFSRQTAQDLAILLRYGPLPLQLEAQ